MEFEFKCPFTADEIASFRQQRIDAVWDWVLGRYPKINLTTLENNLEKIEEVKKYDDACAKCFGVQQCPTQDGNRAECEIMPDGIARLFMTPCPKGHKIPRGHTTENKEVWVKKQ